MRVLVKLGGTLLDSEDSRAAIAEQLTRAFAANREMVVVHGGGKQMTRFLAEQLSTAHWFDITRTRELLHWSPRVPLDEGFSRLAGGFPPR